MELKSLGEVLADAERLAWDAELFLPLDQVWGSDTRCVVEPMDIDADESAVPAVAARNGLERALLVSQVQDIVINAREQRPKASVEELVQALRFYFDRDAFIDFGKSADEGAAPDAGRG